MIYSLVFGKYTRRVEAPKDFDFTAAYVKAYMQDPMLRGDPSGVGKFVLFLLDTYPEVTIPIEESRVVNLVHAFNAAQEKYFKTHGQG